MSLYERRLEAERQGLRRIREKIEKAEDRGLPNDLAALAAWRSVEKSHLKAIDFYSERLRKRSK